MCILWVMDSQGRAPLPATKQYIRRTNSWEATLLRNLVPRGRGNLWQLSSVTQAQSYCSGEVAPGSESNSITRLSATLHSFFRMSVRILKTRNVNIEKIQIIRMQREVR